MAISFTNSGVSLNTTTGSDVYSTSSWTPPSNALLIVFFAARDVYSATANNSPSSITHGSINFTKVQARSPGNDSQMEMWVADSGSSPGNNTTTITFTESKSGLHFHVFAATGVNLTGGAANAVQTPTGGTTGGNGTSGSVTLDSPLQSANRPVSFFFHRANETLTGRTNWTDVSNGNFASPNSGALSQYRSDAFETTASATWTTSVVWGGMAAEIKASGGVTTIGTGLATETDTALGLIPVAQGWALVSTRGTQSESTAGTTVARSPQANMSVGNWVIVTAGWDNNTANDGYTDNLSCSDTDAHTWTKILEYTNANGGAGNGVRIAAWITRVTSTISTSDTITVTGSSVTKRTMGISEWSHPAATAVFVKGYNASSADADTNGPVVSVGSGTVPRMFREGSWWEKPLPDSITVHSNNTNYLLELNGEYSVGGLYAEGPTYNGYKYVQFSGGVDTASATSSFDQPIYRVQPTDTNVVIWPKAAAPDYGTGWTGGAYFIAERFRPTGTSGYTGQSGLDGTGEGVRLPSNISQYFNAEAGVSSDSPAVIYDAEKGYYAWFSELHYYPSVNKWYAQGGNIYKVTSYGITSDTPNRTTKTKPSSWPATLNGTGIAPENYQDDTENYGHRGVNSMVSCVDYDRTMDYGIVPYTLELFAARTDDTGTYKFPMDGGENNKGGYIPEGTRFRLKITVDIDTEVDTYYPLGQNINGALVTETRRDQIKAILHGLQEFGCFVGDNSGSGSRFRLEALQRENRSYLWQITSNDLKFWPPKTTWEAVQDNYDPPTPSGSLLPIVERLWLTVAGIEGPTADTLTGDSDYTNLTTAGTNDSGDDTDIRHRSQYRIGALGSDTVQFTNSVARDWATFLVAIEAVSAGAKTIDVGLNTETDTARPITSGGLKTVSVGLAGETDTPFAHTVQVAGVKTVDVGLVTELDSALSAGVQTQGQVVITQPLDTTYRVVICDLSNVEMDEVPTSNLAYGFELNSAGFCTFVLPLLHLKATRSLLTPGQRIVRVYRNETLVWGGYLWDASISDERGVRFSCRGFLSRLEKRYIDSTKNYVNEEQCGIAWDLIQFTQAKTGGDLGITKGTTNTGVKRDIKYPAWERVKIFDAITELSALADGFDFDIDATRTFKTYYPNKGKTKLDLVMEFGKNIFGFSYVDAANTLSNEISALGAGDGPNMCIATAVDTSSRSTYGLLEEAASFSSTKHFSILQNKADALLRLYKAPRWQPQLSLHIGEDFPYDAMEVGDTVPLKIDYGYVDIDQNFRIMNIEFQVSNEGREAVTVHFDSVPARP